MNNAKMWLVVKPTVGIPLFLSAVAISSFAVHVAVVSNTSWVSDYLSGQELGTGSQIEAAAILNERDMNAAKATYVMPSGQDAREVTIIMSDGTPVRAILQPPEVHATSASPGSQPVITQ